MNDDKFAPHEVRWTDDRVSRFWDYLSLHDAGEFFSEKHSRDIADRLVKASKPRTVLDIGCGTGPLVAEFTRRGLAATGIDSSPGVLDAARLRAPDGTFHLGSVGAIPLPDDQFDAATLIETIEHLDDATLALALLEARRVLRPGGTLLITTPNDERLEDSKRQCPDCGAEFHIYQHVRSWTPRTLATALRAGGLDPVSIRATRLLENTSGPERIARRLYYRIRRQAPRLVAIARA